MRLSVPKRSEGGEEVSHPNTFICSTNQDEHVLTMLAGQRTFSTGPNVLQDAAQLGQVCRTEARRDCSRRAAYRSHSSNPWYCHVNPGSLRYKCPRIRRQNLAGLAHLPLLPP